MPADASPAHDAVRLRRFFRAFQARNYRLYVAGQSLSLLGTWMQRLALGWWVYQHTHSALVLGIVGGAGQLPAVLLAPLAGALVDRWDRQRLLIVTQLLAMLQALGFAWLVLAEVTTLGPLLLCSVLLGLVNAVDIPARQALVVDLVDQPEDLGNALALNAALTNGARLLGPALASVVIMRLGAGLCFLLNGLSYLAVLAALGAMHLPPRPAPPPRTTPAGAGARRGALRLGLCPGSCHPHTAGRDESPGHAVSGPPASVCDRYSAWQCAHARAADGGVRCGSDPWGVVSGVPGQRARVKLGARAVDRPLRAGTRRVVVCAVRRRDLAGAGGGQWGDDGPRDRE